MNSQDVAIEPDIYPDAETSYKALRRAIQRGIGFSLLFVRCTPVKGEEIVERIKVDLPQKRIQVLNLDANTENLYHLVENLTEEQSFDVLFIRGLEESLFQYEDREQLGILGRSKGTGYGGNWESIPRILGHLNLSRERFRDNFKLCLVFLLPEFALNYFIRRAPDFFDWRSNVYEFPTERELVIRESDHLTSLDNSYQEYCEQLPEQRIAKLAKIKSYLEENLDLETRSSLWFEKGLIHSAAKEYEEALYAHDKAIAITPDYQSAWIFRGITLFNLGRYEEVISAFDQAININPNDQIAIWYFQSNALFNLERYEEAISFYDKALAINPNDQIIWNQRGVALFSLRRYEEAIYSYDKALAINPDDEIIWNKRGVALFNIGRYKEASASYDKTISINPDFQIAWQNRGIALFNLGRYEEAINCYDKYIAINPEQHEVWLYKGNALDKLGRNEEAILSYDKSLQIIKSQKNKNEEIVILNRISNSYFKTGRIKEIFITGQRMIEVMRSMEASSISEIFIYPQWVRKLLKFGVKGRFQAILVLCVIVVFVPIWFIWFLTSMSFSMFGLLKQIFSRKTP